MTTEENVQSISGVAAADLSALQYRFVKGSKAAIAICDAAGENALGVLQNAPVSGEAARVAYGGAVKVEAGAAISAGALVATDANGKAKTAVANTVDTTGSNATEDLDGSFVMGQALEAAAADGDIISVMIAKIGAAPSAVS